MDNIEAKQDALNGFLERCEEGRPTTIELARNLTDGKEHVNITLRQTTEKPVRMESPAKAHAFWSIEGFVAYLEKYAAASNLVVLGDPNTGQIQAVLDERKGDGFEVVIFEPLMHPFWKPWQESLGKKIEIREFAKFIVEQKHIIVNPDARQLAAIFKQVRLSKNVTIDNGIGDGAINGVVVESKIAGQHPSMPLSLPEQIVIHCPMFMEQEAMDITIDLILDGTGNSVVVEPKSSDAEAKRIEAIEAMLHQVHETLTEATATLGKVKHESWKYVEVKPAAKMDYTGAGSGSSKDSRNCR
jgi:hypothetical protein